MFWLIFALCAHLVFGLICRNLAINARVRVEPWFLAGTVLGGLAVIAFLLLERYRPLGQA
jgi:hypothetical protein